MATLPEPTDPRLTQQADVRPVVAPARGGTPVWLIAGIVALLAIALFLVLDARRRALTAPAIQPRSADAVAAPAPPPALYIPAEPAPPPLPVLVPVAPTAAPSPVIVPHAPQPQPQIVYVPQQASPVIQSTRPAPERVAGEPALVIDTTVAAASPTQGLANAGPGSGSGPQQASVAGARTGAGVLANRPTTVPQGTLIPAVLETALDSTRPGLARAIVSRDIRGFDGSRILVPRGSRLIGEYRSDVEQGQNRMLVNWIRLIRPDGATIAIGSPASDPLGQGGIKAEVNSHFFERFSGAILQSALDIGVNLASRAASSSVYLGFPGSFQGGQSFAQNEVRPTLKVKAATSISIFVARDLDFTGVEK
ncbi:MAG: TrbI/VirB10 family protein [Sphingomonas sp.]